MRLYSREVWLRPFFLEEMTRSFVVLNSIFLHKKDFREFKKKFFKCIKKHRYFLLSLNDFCFELWLHLKDFQVMHSEPRRVGNQSHQCPFWVLWAGHGHFKDRSVPLHEDYNICIYKIHLFMKQKSWEDNIMTLFNTFA